MGIRQSIMATLGLDTGDFKREFANAERINKESAQRMARDQAAASGAQGGGLGGLEFKGTKVLKRAAGSITKDLLAGSDAADVFTTSTLTLANTLKIGLGGTLALAAIGPVVKGLLDAKARTDAFASSIDDLKGKIAVGFKSQSIESVITTFTDAEAVVQKITKTVADPGIMGKALNALYATAQIASHGASGKTMDEQEQVKAIKVRADALDEAGKKTKQLADIEATRLEQGERAAELAKANMKFDEILGSTKIPKDSDAFGQMTRQRQQEIDSINKKFDDAAKKGRSEDIGALAKQAMDTMRGEAENADKVNDAEADKVEARKEALGYAQDELKILNEEAAGLEDAAALDKIRLDYKKRIAEAADDETRAVLQQQEAAAVANERRKQGEKAATAASQEAAKAEKDKEDAAKKADDAKQKRIDNFLRTPQQKRQDEKDARDRRRAERTLANRDRQAALARSKNEIGRRAANAIPGGAKPDNTVKSPDVVNALTPIAGSLQKLIDLYGNAI